MFSAYLNSLYRLLYEQNLLVTIYRQMRRVVLSMWRLPNNLNRLSQRRYQLEQHLHAMETVAAASSTHQNHQFNVLR
jgi:hypothetical protein